MRERRVVVGCEGAGCGGGRVVVVVWWWSCVVGVKGRVWGGYQG
jgi:hypothetical protein